MTDRKNHLKRVLANAKPIRIASLPTAVQSLEKVADNLGLTQLWVKRDDQTAALYGGNKVRKLQYLLADAKQRGYTKVATVGGLGSNHVVATCLHGQKLGFQCTALHFEQPISEHVRNNLRLLSTSGAQCHLLPSHIPASDRINYLREWAGLHPDVYFIPPGGSSAIGTLGFVEAGVELAEQIEAGACPVPDKIYIAAGSGASFAGLLIAFHYLDIPIQLKGVRVIDESLMNEVEMNKLITICLQQLKALGLQDSPKIEKSSIIMEHGYIGEAYGVSTDLGERATSTFAKADISLEQTYTAKTAAAILDQAAELAHNNEKVLYWHTLSSASQTERLEKADVVNDLPEEYHGYFT